MYKINIPFHVKLINKYTYRVIVLKKIIRPGMGLQILRDANYKRVAREDLSNKVAIDIRSQKVKL